jgi:hypothetical protein
MSALSPQSSAHECTEQGVWPVGPRCELGMELGCHEPRMIPQLHDLDQTLIRRQAAQNEALAGERFPIGVVELVAMAVPLPHLGHPVGFVCLRPFQNLAGVRPQPHRSAFLLDAPLIGHEVDHGVWRARVEFGAVRAGEATGMSSQLDHSALLAQALAEEWNMAFPRVADRLDLALDPARAESSGNQDAIGVSQQLLGAKARHIL